MTRYLKQRDRFSCGPHALVNAATFQIESLRKRRMRLSGWKDYCGCGLIRSGRNNWNGTSPKVFGKYCKQLGYRRLWKPTMRKMDLALQRGHAIIVQVRWSRKHGHYFLITERRPKFFRCINLYVNEKSGWVSKRKFYRRHRKHVLEFRAWIVPKADQCL